MTVTITEKLSGKQEKAGVKKLVLGHYSARYDDMRMFENEARTVFENTILGDEGMCITL